MSLLRVPIYPTRNLAVEIDPGARSIVAGTGVSFTTNPDGSITINSSGGGTGTVTSVGATGSTGLTIGGSPITTSGTLTFTLSANLQSWSGIAPSSKADTSALGNYVLKAGDTMTGALFINNGGLSTRNAGQVKVYDSNNDTPIELGLGFSSGTDRNGYLWNRNNGFLSFGTNNQERIRIRDDGNIAINGGALFVQNNDIYTYRTGGTTGVIFLNNASTRYLFNDGSNYVMPGQGLVVGGTIQSDTLAFTGLSGGQGFQLVWNTVQSGQGRFEFVNNRGGGAGGFTWWDRANTGAGFGTALAALNANGYFVNGVVQFNTSGTSVGQLTAWPGNSSYVAFGNTAMSSTEYAVLTASPSVDSTTYISSAAGGSVRIRPSANSTVGEAVFSTSGLSLAKYVWPDANTAGSKKLSRISVGTAAPSGLIDGELYLRY